MSQRRKLLDEYGRRPSDPTHRSHPRRDLRKGIVRSWRRALTALSCPEPRGGLAPLAAVAVAAPRPAQGPARPAARTRGRSLETRGPATRNTAPQDSQPRDATRRGGVENTTSTARGNEYTSLFIDLYSCLRLLPVSAGESPKTRMDQSCTFGPARPCAAVPVGRQLPIIQTFVSTVNHAAARHAEPKLHETPRVASRRRKAAHLHRPRKDPVQPPR